MKATKTKLLLTGIAGFIGSHILQHILEKTDWDIVGVASWQHKGTPERIEQVLSKNPAWRERLTIITHDLAAPFPERTKKRIDQCDYIVNAAAESHVDRSIEDPVPFVQNNVNVILTMLEFAREYKPKVFLQVSTDEVYGVAPKKINHKEWSPIVPSNAYSASKACQEAICIAYWRSYGVPVVITNTMNNFGEMQDSEKYMAKIIKHLVEGTSVPVHGSSTQVGSRYYLHARNHADAILWLLGRPVTMYDEQEDIKPDRYNIVGDKELDNLEVAKMMADIMGAQLKYHFVDHHKTRPGHDRRYALDGSKLKNLGWTPPVPFKESLERYIAWTIKHPIWL